MLGTPALPKWLLFSSYKTWNSLNIQKILNIFENAISKVVANLCGKLFRSESCIF